MNEMIVSAVVEELPSVVELLKALVAQHHPKEPEPTSEEVLAALETAVASSRAKDERWLAAHPNS